MMTPEKIFAFRSRLQFTQDELARYLGWPQDTLDRYERGVVPTETHLRELVGLIDGPAAVAAELPRATMNRRYRAGGYACDELDLIEAYRQIAMNPVYDDLMRNAHRTRYHMLTAAYRRQPKGF